MVREFYRDSERVEFIGCFFDRKEEEKNATSTSQPPLLGKKNSSPLLQVVLLFRQYSQWDADPTISAILLRGAGGRAFCAGGDVKAAASAVASGRPEAAFAFFAAEYKLDHLISRLRKPHVALVDGIVMGGGAGLALHGTCRVATETTTFAMPECAIGLFPDVGTTFFLPRACSGGLAVARWIALTGARLRGREVAESGLATHFVARERLPELVDALAAALNESPSSSSSDTSSSSSSWFPSWLLRLPLLRMFRRKKKRAQCCPVAAVLSRFEEKASLSSSSSSSSFAALSRDVERLFGRGCSSLEQLRRDVSREAAEAARASGGNPPEWLRAAAAALEAECPQSQALAWALLEASTRNDNRPFSLADTLRLEWRILRRVSLLPGSDFVEGVQAKLLSKPARAARWRGAGDELAAREVVARPLASPREELELEGGRGEGAAAASFQSRL